ncbi:MAG: HAMP domain-containing protein, partial [Bacteroidota bacterium]
MKINLRLLLITFTVIVIISLSSTFIYYSTTTALLKKQYSKNLLNSSNDFAFEFQNGIRIIEDDFDKIKKSLSDFDSLAIDTTLLDFVFTLDKNNLIDQNNFVHSKKIQSPALLNSIKDFIDVYPNIILLYTKDNNSQKIFYGKLISADYLEKISLKIRAEIAFITNNLPNEITNSESNEKYLGNLLNTINEYKSQNRTNVYYEELKSVDFFAVTHKPKTFSAADDPSFFIIFNTPSELSEFRDTIQMIILTFALAGVFLSLIFILLFTTKLRHQISLLSKTTKLIAEGNLSERVPIVTKDELGQLGTAFNDMLERIESKEKIEQRYLEIITIINENPSIDELSNQILEKIIRVTETTFGAFYLVNENELNLISTYGISEKTLQAAVEPDLYS